ncbi:MAG TPA: hypothetical protein VGE29_19140 [Prosthecobacter sp.]
MSTRVPCINPDCSNTILPATATANQGLCAPCLGAIRKKEHDEYVRLNRKTVDLYAGVTEPVEMIQILLTPRKHDPLIVYAPAPASAEELFARLSEEDANRLQKLAVAALEKGEEDFAEDLAKHLATLTPFPLTDIQRAWVSRDHHWPSIVFRTAEPEIRDRIIASLTAGNANPNLALSALAWVDDEVVRACFTRWDEETPSWASKLYIRPSEYGRVAGWEISGGKRHQLYHDVCYGIQVAPDSLHGEPLKLFGDASQPCPWCNHELSHMMAVNLADPRFAFLGLSGPGFSVLTCHCCTAYAGAFFSKFDSLGHTSPHPKNVRPEWLPSSDEWQSPAWKDQRISLTLRPAIQSVDWCMELKNSQLGGHPTWVQDSDYPRCPDCSRSMRFVAQLDEGDIPYNEGTYYAFVCEPCQVTATSYQQT